MYEAAGELVLAVGPYTSAQVTDDPKLDIFRVFSKSALARRHLTGEIAEDGAVFEEIEPRFPVDKRLSSTGARSKPIPLTLRGMCSSQMVLAGAVDRCSNDSILLCAEEVVAHPHEGFGRGLVDMLAQPSAKTPVILPVQPQSEAWSPVVISGPLVVYPDCIRSGNPTCSYSFGKVRVFPLDERQSPFEEELSRYFKPFHYAPPLYQKMILTPN